MKLIILLLFIIFAKTEPLFGQHHLSNDSIFKGIKDGDDYSNIKRKKGIIEIKKGFTENLFADSSTIVILNNKIYSGSSKEYRQLNLKSVIYYSQVRDDSSSTGIKLILIIKTK